MKKSHEAAVKALSSKKRSKKVKSIHVHKAKGGFIADHHTGDGEPERHVIPNLEALQAHMATHLGEVEPQGETPADEQAESIEPHGN